MCYTAKGTTSSLAGGGDGEGSNSRSICGARAGKRQGRGVGKGRRRDPETLRRRLDHEARRGGGSPCGGDPDGIAGARSGAGGGGRAARAGDGDLWAGVVGEDDAVPAHRGGSAAAGRGVRLHRHGTRAGPGVCGALRGEGGGAVYLAAGYGGAGVGDCGDAGEERWGGRGGGG